MGVVIWLTGLSGAGKSTVAGLLAQRLRAEGQRTYLLDGDVLRTGLNRDLGFSAEDRAENVRRVGEVAWLMADAGLIVVVALISPFQRDRQAVRERFAPRTFFEVHVDVPLAVAESRDPKGLYRKARAGLLRDFTGIDSPYEPPAMPEVHLPTATLSPETAVDIVVERLRAAGVVS